MQLYTDDSAEKENQVYFTQQLKPQSNGLQSTTQEERSAWASFLLKTNEIKSRIARNLTSFADRCRSNEIHKLKQ